MKFVSLLSAAYVGGVLRHPHEGALPVEDAEADQLAADGVATDVTEDFAAKQREEATVESITAPGGAEGNSAPANPHQAEVAPQAAETEIKPKPARRRAAAAEE